MTEHSRNADAMLCGVVYPNSTYRKGETKLTCVKDPGHENDADPEKRKHAVLLGIHPEYEDGYGQMWPSQEEWATWN